MFKLKAKRILKEIKKECNKQKLVKNAYFILGTVFSAEDSEYGYDGIPKSWRAEFLPNLK